MRRFEFQDGKSNKFWQIEYGGGSEFEVRWGRIGTDGQTQTKSFASPAKAGAESEKLIAEKLKKGYQEVGAAEAPPANSQPVQASTTSAQLEPKAAKTGARATQAGTAVARAVAAGATAVSDPPATAAGAVVGQVVSEAVTRGAFQVHWTDAARRKVDPRRGGPAPKVDLKKCLARLEEVYGFDNVAPAKRVANCAIDKALRPALLKRAEAGVGKPSADPRVEGAFADLMSVTDGLWDRADEIGSDLVHLWVDRFHPAYALEVLLECYRLAGSQNTGYYVGPWRVLRAYLAACSEADYQKAAEIAEAGWASPFPLPLTMSFLFPENQERVRRVAAEYLAGSGQVLTRTSIGRILMGATTQPEQLSQLAAAYAPFGDSSYIKASPLDFVHTALDQAGPDFIAAGLKLAELLKSTPARRELARLLALIEAPEIADQMREWLGDKALGPQARAYFAAFPDLAGQSLEGHRGVAAQVLGEVQAQNQGPQAGAAEVGELPDVLASPPWKRPAPKASKPTVVNDLTPLPHPEVIHWEPGEDRNLKGIPYHRYKPADGKELVARLKQSKKGETHFAERLIGLPDAAEAVALFNDLPVETWNPYGLRSASDAIPGRFLAHFGTAVLSGVVATVKVCPDLAYPYLQKVESPRLAEFWAEAMTGKKGRRSAQLWLQAFPRAAAIGLVPAALGPAGKRRQLAEQALLFVSHKGRRSVVEEVAREYGVAALIAELLNRDPLLQLPARIPPLPSWWSASTLPRPRLKTGGSLPVESLDHLGTMLMISDLETPYAGLELIREACTADSLAEFAWGVFSAWVNAGGPSKEDWAFAALAHLGGDEAARRLTPELRKWPGDGLSARATRGLDILAAIGSDLALMHLNGIAQKIRFKALQDRARERIEEIAEARGLTLEELADRLAPDFDLEPGGWTWLSFGPRRFRVGFDEQLKPTVHDESGALLKDLPKPIKSDDQSEAEAATARWKSLKKDVKAVATLQVERLEQAMARRRRWDPDGFRMFLVDHPLVYHLTRRLIWGVYQNDRPVTTFRVAEDRTLADAQDNLYQLPSEAVIGLVHPLELDPGTRSQWASLLADYELIQPFDQLSRPIYQSSAAEAEVDRLTRFEGRSALPGAILGLENRGWRRGYVESGCITEMLKPLGSGRGNLSLQLNDGVYVVEPGREPVQLGPVHLPSGLAVGDLHPVEFSELVADLERL